MLCEIDNYPLPNDKILDWYKLKAFADDKVVVTEKLKFVFGRVENIVGKGENAGYQHFLLFLQYFQKACLSRSLKIVTVWIRVNAFTKNTDLGQPVHSVLADLG